MAAVLLLGFGWPMPTLVAPPGTITLEAPAGPCGIPAGTLNQPIPEDLVDATVTPRRDPGLTAHIRESEPLAAKSASPRSPSGAALFLPADPGDVHRVALLPRPPPAATVS